MGNGTALARLDDTIEFTARDYQLDGFNQILDGLSRHERVVYVLPPGGGKTWLYLMVAYHFIAQGLRVCVVAPQTSLVQQTIEKVRDLGWSFGVIWRGHYGESDPDALLQVASAYTLARQMDQHAFDLIILDEAHHAAAATWTKILDAHGDGKVLGVTATPQRGDGKGLDHAGFTLMIQGPEIVDLTPRYLSRYNYYAPSHPDLSEVAFHGRDYTMGDLAGHVDFRTLVGDAVDFYHQNSPKARALVYCVSVDETLKTAAAFRVAGYKAVAITGSTPPSERTPLLASLREGDGAVELICSCDTLGEGIDVPGVEVVILLRPTRSLAVYMQQGGRGLRVDPKQPMKVLRIHDHTSNWTRFRGLDPRRSWRLDGTISVDESEEARAQGRRCCDQCQLVAVPDEAGCCPGCGAPIAADDEAGAGIPGWCGNPQYRWVEGELVLVDGGWVFPAQRKDGKYEFCICNTKLSLGTDEVIARARFEAGVLRRTLEGRMPYSEAEARAWFNLPKKMAVCRPNKWEFPEINSAGRYVFYMRRWGIGLGRDAELARALFDTATEHYRAAGRLPHSENELRTWFGRGPKRQTNPGKTYVYPEENSWRFNRFYAGETFSVRGYPGKSERFAMEVASRADKILGDTESVTKDVWCAALNLTDHGPIFRHLKEENKARKGARRKAYEEQLAAWAVARREREENRNKRGPRAPSAKPGEFPFFQSRKKNSKQQYYARRNGQFFILGCDLNKALQRYEKAREMWLNTGKSWPSDENEIRGWFGLGAKHEG